MLEVPRVMDAVKDTERERGMRTTGRLESRGGVYDPYSVVEDNCSEQA